MCFLSIAVQFLMFKLCKLIYFELQNNLTVYINCIYLPNLLNVLGCFSQDSELKRTVDESERIKRAYGHYFDLCIVNDGLEAAFRSLRSALEKLAMEHQWVPVSWVFWKSPRAHWQEPQVEGWRTIYQLQMAVSMDTLLVKGQVWWPASCRAFLYKLWCSSVEPNVKFYFICQNWNNLIDICGEEFRDDYEV